MLLKKFKEFYLIYFPNAKNKSINVVSKRTNDKMFLEYIFSEKSGVISTFESTAISNIMNGRPPKNFVDSIKNNKNLISQVEKTICNDMNNSEEKIKDISENVLKLLYDENKNERLDFLIDIFSNPINNHSIVIGFKWWFLFALLQEEVTYFAESYKNELKNNINYEKINSSNNSSIKQVDKFLKNKGIKISVIGERKCAEISYNNLHELRRLLIDTARGKLYIAGETLGNAFSSANKGDAVIIDNLVHTISSRKLTEINVYLMDPNVLKGANSFDPLETLSTNIQSLIRHLKLVLKSNQCKLNIYFLPFLDIDHAVITDKFMLFRSTKIWTRSRDHKGSVMLYYKYKGSDDCDDQGEYNAHKRYLDTLSANAVLINTEKLADIDNNLSKNLQVHFNIRNAVFELKKLGNFSIDLYKVYNSQLERLAVSSFIIDKSRFTFDFKLDSAITCIDDLYNPQNLLNDNSQTVLLKHIKATERLLNNAIKIYDKRDESGAIIIPSLDLGYPNNIMRLAGGFATGILIDWECGTPIIPIDATVNVCSSSVFKINPSDELLKNFVATIKSTIEKAVLNCGYSFSFTSGNHFLMLANDNDGYYYLVLHSSAKEMKESYFGLYPSEGNWYSSKIKHIYEDNKYLRYIKGDEAEYFIETAHHIEKYNEEIHKWLSFELNCKIKPEMSIIKHHYYMPTDSSIAIGAFAELPGETVPLFSDVKKPVYLFKIGENNWTYNLGGRKGSVCVVPHGWGQQIENIKEFNYNDNVLSFFLSDGRTENYKVISTERIKNELDSTRNPELSKRIRSFKDGYEFLDKCKKCLNGTIEKVLIPKYLYCKTFRGKLEEDK